MKRLLNSRAVNQALRGASLVVTDRRWAAPLSAGALGFGIFAGVAIGPGAAGTLATGAQQIIEIPSSGGGDGQSAGGGAGVASSESSTLPEGGEGGGLEEALPSTVPLAPEPIEPLPAPAPEPAAKPAPSAEEDGEEEETETQKLKGTVVHANPAAGSYAMAIKGGELVSVHAPELPEPGAKLEAPLRRLANGTFAEAGDLEEEKKEATEASFRGAVTYTSPDPAAPAYTVSGRGSSLLVHLDPDPTGAAPQLPSIGTYVTVTASFDSGLRQEKLETEPGPPSTYLDLAGVVKEVSPDGHLLLSADDSRESEADLTLTVPSEIDITKLKASDSYLATAEVDPDGSLKLSGIASDEHTRGAGDPVSAQGDLKRARG
ncbi:MAG TPA: hypothetical protein VFM94_05500 [Solirubrobacterales bacterium]|nr:hypothetical protein [Solirubrobacterales bacterium]